MWRLKERKGKEREQKMGGMLEITDSEAWLG